jgi:phosphonate transport system substrate-binding protein
MMRRRLLILLLLFALPAWAASEARTFRIGLFPYLSPITLIAAHQSLARYLEQALHQPVELLTAPDFRTFIERTDAGEYDAVLTAPHLARMAEQNGGYKATAIYDQKLRAVIIVAADSRLLSVQDLRGATIAEPDPLAIVGALAREMLTSAGLGSNEVHWFVAHSHNGAALSVASGRADAAVVGSVPFAHLSEGLRGSLRVLATSRAIPNEAWMVSTRLGDDRQRAFQSALLDFSTTPAGRHYLKINNLEGIRPLRDGELKSMDFYAALVSEQLGRRR